MSTRPRAPWVSSQSVTKKRPITQQPKWDWAPTSLLFTPITPNLDVKFRHLELRTREAAAIWFPDVFIFQNVKHDSGGSEMIAAGRGMEAIHGFEDVRLHAPERAKIHTNFCRTRKEY